MYIIFKMAVLCGVCLLKMSRNSDHLQCSNCDAYFHLGCGDIDVAKFLTMREDKSLKSWKCRKCNTVASDNVNNPPGDKPVQNSTLDSQRDLNQEDLACEFQRDTSHIGKSTIDKVLESQMQIIDMLKGTHKYIQDVKEENFRLREAVQDNRELINDLREQISNLHAKISQLKQGVPFGNRKAVVKQKSIKITNTSSDAAVMPSSDQSKDTGASKDSAGAVNRTPQSENLQPVSGKNGALDGASDACHQYATDGSKRLDPQNNRVRNHHVVKNTATALIAGEICNTDTGNAPKNDWVEVRSRRRARENKTTGIVGSIIQSCGIQAAPRKAFLYVSRLKPETTCDELAAYLKSRFPEVTCERAQSKFPDHYSSFKVTINFINLESAMKPDIWPMGTYVGRFFRQRAQVSEK